MISDSDNKLEHEDHVVSRRIQILSKGKIFFVHIQAIFIYCNAYILLS